MSLVLYQHVGMTHRRFTPFSFKILGSKTRPPTPGSVETRLCIVGEIVGSLLWIAVELQHALPRTRLLVTLPFIRSLSLSLSLWGSGVV